MNPCTRRESSTTPLQSLALINSDFIANQSRHVAIRVRRLAGPIASPAQQIETAFTLALSRPPRESELQLCLTHLRLQTDLYAAQPKPLDEAAQHALESLCLTLLASNEFLHIE